MVDVNKPVTNPNLVKNIAALREDPSHGNEHAFFHELLKVHFLAPVNIDPLPENKGGNQFSKKIQKYNLPESSLRMVGLSSRHSPTGMNFRSGARKIWKGGIEQ